MPFLFPRARAGTFLAPPIPHTTATVTAARVSAVLMPGRSNNPPPIDRIDLRVTGGATGSPTEAILAIYESSPTGVPGACLIQRVVDYGTATGHAGYDIPPELRLALDRPLWAVTHFRSGPSVLPTVVTTAAGSSNNLGNIHMGYGLGATWAANWALNGFYLDTAWTGALPADVSSLPWLTALSASLPSPLWRVANPSPAASASRANVPTPGTPALPTAIPSARPTALPTGLPTVIG